MKRRILQMFALLCVLALTVCLSGAASGEETQEVRILNVEWQDEDDYDALRPAEVTVSSGETSVQVRAEEAWTGEMLLPEGSKITPAAVEGYAVTVREGDITVITYHHAVKKTSVSASVVWVDRENERGIRPASVQLRLLADGKPYGAAVTAGVQGGWAASWSDLPVTFPGEKKEIVYSVEQIGEAEGYSTAAEGTKVTNTLKTGRLTVEAAVSGLPEGTDASGLKLTVSGPDPRMPAVITLGEMAGGTYDFGEVVPGAYLLQEDGADSLAEGYVMDAEKSRTADAVQVDAGSAGTLHFRYTWKEADGEPLPEGTDPLADVGGLSFEIIGPNYSKTIQYSEFTNGKYELNDLAPGEYTVVERNAEGLVKSYTLTSASVTGMTLSVSAGGEATAKLFNQYAPVPTPGPDDETVDIPVVKVWEDNENRDGNRPGSITVRLYADGAEVDSAVISAAEGWNHTFTEKPRYNTRGEEINYSVNEDAVPMYQADIRGYHIINRYQPEVMSVTVSKRWDDQNNAQNLRPSSLAVTLSNGTTYVLNEQNGWTVTVNNLPTIVNGQPAVYTWTEQSVLHYSQESVVTDGSSTVFTNKVWEPRKPPEGQKPPKGGGTNLYFFEEYDTPLGVEVIINHVGDCFD